MTDSIGVGDIGMILEVFLTFFINIQPLGLK
jgi:hypothetical protein